MKMIKNLMPLIVFSALLFAKENGYKAQEEIIIHTGTEERPVIIENSNQYLPQSREEIDLWVEDFETDYWSSFARNNFYTNANKVHADHAKTAAVLFMYHPHGPSDGVKWGGTTAGITDPGSATSTEDIYWIVYAPITTTAGKTGGRDKDGYVLAAFKDAGVLLDFEATIGNASVTANAETEISDIQWITP